jgi:p-hydroxybenzoate 3-monooxygenase
VAQLCDALVAADADFRFEATVERVEQDGDGATVTMTDAQGRTSTLTGAAVVCCDGARCLFADAIPDARVVELSMPVRWLAVIGTAPPLVPHTIYAAHPRGFAGHMRRGPTQTRYYLEVSVLDTLDDWPEERTRAELTDRLCLDGELDAVGFVDASFLDLRMRVIDPIQHGRVFLAGDAAHVISPAGAKGMNLAIQDAVELAHGLIERFGPEADGARLEAYSATRLPAIWRAQAFSNWMLRLILAGSEEPVTDGGPTFGRGLRQGWISSLQHDRLLATWFAHAYAGADVLPS